MLEGIAINAKIFEVYDKKISLEGEDQRVANHELFLSTFKGVKVDSVSKN